MTLPLWVIELASAFWQMARELEPFPRNLRRPIARAGMLSVVSLPELTVATVRGWLSRCSIACEMSNQDRPLRACLVARNGFGFVFIDGADPDAEQRFSLAHELAHFLRDYWYPRKRVVKQLGPTALQVLDGERTATAEERLHALLCSVPLGFHMHLMERDGNGNPATRIVAQAEEKADRLAYELLAPAEHVLAGSGTSGKSALAEKLVNFYDLPWSQAARYARILLPAPYVDPLLLRLKNLA